MKNAHELSEQYAVDPAYSVEGVRPEPKGLSLYSARQVGPYWLYNWGHLEAYLFNRMRHESLLVCKYVDNPGRFRTFNPVLYARRTLSLDSLPRDAKTVVYHSGIVDLRVNGATLLHLPCTPKPTRRTVDLRPCLKKGENKIIVRLHRTDEPPALLLDGPFLKTDADWQVSCDHVVWADPACFPHEGGRQFPHQERLPDIKVSPRGPQGDMYDFGAELLCRPRVKARGRGNIALFPGESPAEAKNTLEKDMEQYVPPLKVSTASKNPDIEMALRYLRLTPSRGVKIEQVSVSAPMYPTKYRGAFACSDELLNRIWMHSAYTLRLCMRELLIDAVKRDRLPWVGDLYMGILCNCFSFAEKDIIHRTLTALYSDAPEAVDFNGIIDYTLWWVISLLEYVLFFGDLAYMARVRERFYCLMRILEEKEDEDGFLPSESFYWIFIDWAQVDKKGISSCLQMIYIMALDAAGGLATLDGESSRASHFVRKADALRKKCRTWFWKEKRRVFVDNWDGEKQNGNVSRHANLFAVLSGTAKDNQIEPILDNVLLNDSVPPVGTPYMMALEALALSRCGRRSGMLRNVRRYWGGMLDKGAGTFWEAYDPKAKGAEHYAFYGRPFGKSLCHMWSAGPIFLLSGELFGLRALEPGWRRFTIAPHLADLQWMCVSVPTPHGNIEIDVDENKVFIKVPEGAVLERTIRGEHVKTHAGACSLPYDEFQND
ncbi:MAG: alpha-L-rhamnosidase-related protein [Planctomycetota bacterium]